MYLRNFPSKDRKPHEPFKIVLRLLAAADRVTRLLPGLTVCPLVPDKTADEGDDSDAVRRRAGDDGDLEEFEFLWTPTWTDLRRKWIDSSSEPPLKKLNCQKSASCYLFYDITIGQSIVQRWNMWTKFEKKSQSNRKFDDFKAANMSIERQSISSNGNK